MTGSFDLWPHAIAFSDSFSHPFDVFLFTVQDLNLTAGRQTSVRVHVNNPEHHGNDVHCGQTSSA